MKFDGLTTSDIYKVCGYQGANGCPMLPRWKVEMGKGTDGKEWMCEITPTSELTHLMWNVDFDTTDEYMAEGIETDDPQYDPWSTPFLRTEVLYAKDYHAAAVKYYHRKKVEYKDIKNTIKQFAKEKGIE